MLAFYHLPIPICLAGFDLLPLAVGIEELEAVLQGETWRGSGSKSIVPGAQLWEGMLREFAEVAVGSSVPELGPGLCLSCSRDLSIVELDSSSSEASQVKTAPLCTQ